MLEQRLDDPRVGGYPEELGGIAETMDWLAQVNPLDAVLLAQAATDYDTDVRMLSGAKHRETSPLKSIARRILFPQVQLDKKRDKIRADEEFLKGVFGNAVSAEDGRRVLGDFLDICDEKFKLEREELLKWYRKELVFDRTRQEVTDYLRKDVSPVAFDEERKKLSEGDPLSALEIRDLLDVRVRTLEKNVRNIIWP